MNYPSIRIEGAILSPDILGQVEALPGQRPSDFGIDTGTKVKDEIGRAWADAQDCWRVFQRKLETVKVGSNATTETRNLWMVPLLGLLRYNIEFQPRGTELDGRLYAISHRASNRADAPVQIIGSRDPAGLDKKPANSTRRMSAHALVQEFLNLHEQLYGLVTDGRVLRLLRDSSRLVRQSYLEFDLERIFTDGLFADFAILYRLLHATRLPLQNDTSAESLIEQYHHDSLESGARIRKGLSKAVEQAILDFGSGFLSHPDNDALRTAVGDGELSADDYYQQLLRLIYRLLFLMVIEERDLVFPADAPRARREIHREFYSVARLRSLSEKRYLADPRRHDLWLAIQASVRLFEADGPGTKLGIAPLAGDLFAAGAIGSLAGCTLGNNVLLGCLRSLSLYRHPDSGQLIRVNYAALNVEEFGSVYEGLLKYTPSFSHRESAWVFELRPGDDDTQSHYTEDALVQPLIRHSLDQLIAERLNAADPEAALLDLRIADVACGSGHILLAAARRIATELAVVRTGEEQPSPSAYRAALRDAIRHCIYGVDLNPLAVELCKVALWLEAHIPGQPLNFLDHHVKCGNAIVGFTGRQELGQGVPTEAFKTRPGDDKEIAAAYRKRNKEDLKHQEQASLDFTPELRGHLDAVLEEWQSLSALPEQTSAQIDAKKERFAAFAQSEHASLLRTVADIPVAQFYIPKVPSNEANLVIDGEFRSYWCGRQVPQGRGADAARSMGEEKRFFHWFLEFPAIMQRGGFDCILGNPPFMGGKRISGAYGDSFLGYVKYQFAPASGGVDLVGYFVRRVFSLLRDGGYQGLISTNTIAQADTRAGGLEVVLSTGGEVSFAQRSMRWPGRAAVEVSLVCIRKGLVVGSAILDGVRVPSISSFLAAGEELAPPHRLASNANHCFMGSNIIGDGFIVTPATAVELKSRNPAAAEIIRPFLNGSDLNSCPTQKAKRYVIDVGNMDLDAVATRYPECLAIIAEKVKPLRDKSKRKTYRERWWQFGEKAVNLYRAISGSEFVLATALTSKGFYVSTQPVGIVYSHGVGIFAFADFGHFALLHSNMHEQWAWHVSSTMRAAGIRYTPSIAFETFAFPVESGVREVAGIGYIYHQHRKALMQSLWLGLTKIYNLFHASNLSPELVAQVSKKDAETAAAGFEALLGLRRLHVALDLAVRDAYAWKDLDLEHDFHDVEILPENDRVRYTISPAARREVLKRLLAENHARSEAEAKNPAGKPPGAGGRREITADVPDLFGGES